MNVWKLFLLFEIILCLVVLTFVFIGWWRKVRRVSKAHSPEHRLKIPNLWTAIERGGHGCFSQMMRMEDGNFILLSVELDTTRVLVGPRFDSVESFTEVVSLPASHSHKSRSQEKAAILSELRKQIGFPRSVTELRDKSKAFSSPE